MQRARVEAVNISHTDSITKKLQSYSYNTNQLYSDIPETGSAGSGLAFMDTFSMANKLGMSIPNLAPDVDIGIDQPVGMVNMAPTVPFSAEIGPQPAEGPRKKKYAKEAWPGRKPTHGLLV